MIATIFTLIVLAAFAYMMLQVVRMRQVSLTNPSNPLTSQQPKVKEQRAMRKPQNTPLREQLNERFTDAADWISSAMGTPANILVWFALVAGWFLIFAVDPALQTANFMPSWFTSLPFNLPLNLITTLAELFIGFLVAAASNRIERRNHQQMQRLDKMEAQMLRMEKEHGQQLASLHQLIGDLHTHTTCAGHTTIESAPPAPSPSQSATPVAEVDSPAPAVKRTRAPRVKRTA